MCCPIDENFVKIPHERAISTVESYDREMRT